MISITVPAVEKWDEQNEMFVTTKAQTLQLEHSLVSIQKWESKWCKPFMTNQDKTREETIDYIKCMTLTQNVNPDVYQNLTRDNIQAINDYISAPMTATTFSDTTKKGTLQGEQITAELVYYWMIALNIPQEYRKWHLNQLITLIKVCNIKNQPPKKMSRREVMNRNTAINAARRKQLNTKG